MLVNPNASPQSFAQGNATGQIFVPWQRDKRNVQNPFYDSGSTQQITVQTVNQDSMDWRVDRLVLIGTAPVPFDVAIFISNTPDLSTQAVADIHYQTVRKAIVPEDELYVRTNEYLTVQFQSLDSGGGFFCGFNLFYTAGHFVQVPFSGVGNL